MSHKPYYFIKRHDRLTNGKPTYYVRFRDDAGDILPWRSTGETSKTRAELWALEQYKNNTIAVRESLTFGSFASNWWVWDKCDYIRGKLARGQRISQAYAENQRRNLEHHILPAFKGKILSKITAQMIETWLMTLREKKKLAPVTCNHILATVKVMFSEAHRLGGHSHRSRGHRFSASRDSEGAASPHYC
jgi:hypothetical protein